METDQTIHMMREEQDYSLKAHNTFGIDVTCRRFVEYATVQEAVQLARQLRADSQPLLIIGGGSNLLLTAPFLGTVVHSAISHITVADDHDAVFVTAGSGVEWDTLVDYCVTHGYHGAENLSLIPGDVGASAVQNIGAYGAEACDIIYKVEAVSLADGSVVTMMRDDCHYGYRDSRFKHEWRNRYLITCVTYRLSKTFSPRLDYGNIRAELQRLGIGDEPTAQQLRDTIIGIRRQKLPDHHVLGNAGSFFVNPVVSGEKAAALQADYPQMPSYPLADGRVKVPAAWLIDQCGWKGRSMGPAAVHDKQALVLVNKGGATGADIMALCNAIRHDVVQRFGIDIQPEVNIV